MGKIRDKITKKFMGMKQFENNLKAKHQEQKDILRKIFLNK